MITRNIAIGLFLAGGLALAGPLGPGIVDLTMLQGDQFVRLHNPAAAGLGAHESDDDVFYFVETLNHLVSGHTNQGNQLSNRNDVSPYSGGPNPDIYDSTSDLFDTWIVAPGTRVNSYFFSFDPVNGPQRVRGRIRFAFPILGIQVLKRTLSYDPPNAKNPGNTQFQNPFTNYADLKGVDFDGPDEIRVTNPYTLRFDFRANPAADQFRVLTAIPEPATALLAALGLALIFRLGPKRS